MYNNWGCVCKSLVVGVLFSTSQEGNRLKEKKEKADIVMEHVEETAISTAPPTWSTGSSFCAR